MNESPLIIIPSNVIKNDNKTEEEIVQEKRNSTEKSGTHGNSIFS